MGKIQGAFGWYLERDAIQDGEQVVQYYFDGVLDGADWTAIFPRRHYFHSFDEALAVYNKHSEPTEAHSSARICANEKL